MRVESVADALDMTANTVRTLIKRGELKTMRMGCARFAFRSARSRNSSRGDRRRSDDVAFETTPAPCFNHGAGSLRLGRVRPLPLLPMNTTIYRPNPLVDLRVLGACPSCSPLQAPRYGSTLNLKGAAP